MTVAAGVRLRPLFDRVLIRPDEAVQTSTGGIIIPERAQGRSEMGTVLEVGPGERNMKTGGFIAPSLRSGDRVRFGRYAGTEIELNNETLWMMRECEILGVEEEEV